MRRITVLVGLAFAFTFLIFAISSSSSSHHSNAQRQSLGPCPTGLPAIGKPLSAENLPNDVADITNYLGSNPLPRNANPNANIDPATIEVQITTVQEVLAKLGEADDGCSGTVIYVEFMAVMMPSSSERYQFQFLGPSGITASYPIGFEVFLVQNGNLLLAGGNPVAYLPTPTP